MSKTTPWETDERKLRHYGLGKLGETVGDPEWRIVRDLDGVQPRCGNCKGRIVQVRVRTKSDRVHGGEGWCYYFGCPCCPYASPALLVADCAAAPYAVDFVATQWVTPDTPLPALDVAIKNLEAAETALLAEPDPTDLLCVGLEAVQAAIKTLRGS